MKLKKLPSLDDIVLTPRTSKFGKGDVDVDIFFSVSGRNYKGKPLIVGGAWDGEEAIRIAGLGALVMVEPSTDLVELLADGPGDDDDVRKFIEQMVWPVNADSTQEFEDAADSLGLSLMPRYLWIIGDEYPFSTTERLRKKYPALTIFAGNYVTTSSISRNYFADVVVMGRGFATAELEAQFGIRTDLADLVEGHYHSGWASALGLYKPADFIKSFALGADFCVIDPGFRDNTFEELLGAIAGACYMLGADNPHQLPGSTQIGVR